MLSLVLLEQTASNKERVAVDTLKPVPMHLPHVLPQFAGAFETFRALCALVRTHVSVRLHVLAEVILTFERPTTDKTAMWPVIAVSYEVSTKVVCKQEVTSTSVTRVREFHAIVICLCVLDHVFSQLYGLQKLLTTSRAHMRHYLAARVFPLPMPQLHQSSLITVCRISCGISVSIRVNPVTKHMVCVRFIILFHFVVTVQRLTTVLEGKSFQVIFIERFHSSCSLQNIIVAGNLC